MIKGDNDDDYNDDDAVDNKMMMMMLMTKMVVMIIIIMRMIIKVSHLKFVELFSSFSFFDELRFHLTFLVYIIMI